ncbi:MAG: metallophosphoesterase [Candidatus Nanohalobium sp.]
MKVGLISDIHSNMPALREVLSELKNRNVEKILCAGDLVGYYTRPNEVVEKIREEDITCVKGNHDQGVEGGEFRFNPKARKALRYSKEKLNHENKAFLRELDERKRIKLDNQDIFMAHGSPRRPVEEYVMPEDADKSSLSYFGEKPDVVMLGHTHKAFSKEVEGVKIVNPGSVGKPRDKDPRASFAVLDTESNSVEHFRTEYSKEKFAEEVRAELGDTLAEEILEGR